MAASEKFTEVSFDPSKLNFGAWKTTFTSAEYNKALFMKSMDAVNKAIAAKQQENAIALSGKHILAWLNNKAEIPPLQQHDLNIEYKFNQYDEPQTNSTIIVVEAIDHLSPTGLNKCFSQHVVNLHDLTKMNSGESYLGQVVNKMILDLQNNILAKRHENDYAPQVVHFGTEPSDNAWTEWPKKAEVVKKPKKKKKAVPRKTLQQTIDGLIHTPRNVAI